MRIGAALAWMIGLLACCAAGWALWHFAPIAGSDTRFVISFLPVAGWGVLGLVAGPRRGAPSAVVGLSPEVKSQRKQALAALKGRGFAGRRARYRCPLYVVAGASGAGKTALLERSGISFGAPVEVAEANWWIADDLICVEAPIGADPRRLFALLHSLRPLLPVNGLVLAISPADLTLADQTERREMSDMIGQWVKQLGLRAGSYAPVYVMLTKLDLTPGFSEFFDRLEPQDRAQPWGFTLAFAAGRGTKKEDAVAEQGLEAGFRHLLDAIRSRLIEGLSREVDPVRCGRIQGFGAQVATFEPMLATLLAPVLAPEARQSGGAQLRGIYLTSARQEVLSIDPLLPELAGRFSMPRTGTLPPDLSLDEEEHSYFINGALRRGILPEAGLLARRHPWRRRLLVQAGAAVAVLLACGGLIGLARLQWQQAVESAMLAEAAAAPLGRTFYTTQPAALPAILAGLEPLRDLRSDLPEPNAIPLYSPAMPLQTQLTNAAKATYDAVLVNTLAPHLAVRLESDLVEVGAGADDLKGRVDAAAAAGNAAAYGRWLASIAKTLPAGSRAALADYGEAAYRATGGPRIDPAYVDAARRLIANKQAGK